MGNSSTGTNPYRGLFNQNSEEALKILHPETSGTERELVSSPLKLPVIQEEEPASDDEKNAFWKKLRAFFSGSETNAQDSIEGMLPASFAPFIGKDSIEESYPVFIGESEHASLSGLLKAAAELQSSNGRYPLLERFLPKIIQHIRDQVGSNEVVSFSNALSDGFQAFRDQIEIAKEDRKHLMVMLGEFERNVSREGVLIPFGARIPYLLFNGVLEYDNGPKYHVIEKAKKVLMDLKALYENERANRNGDGKGKDSSLRFAENLVNLENLASLSPSSTSQPMTDERYARVYAVIENLKAAETVLGKNAWIVAETELAKSIGTNLTGLFQNSDIATGDRGSVCGKALKLFNVNIRAVTDVIANIRKAELELNSMYDPDVHDAFFENFSWRQFSEEEFAACPATVVLVDDGELIKEELGSFSDLLAQDLPIRIMAIRTEDYELSETVELHIRQEIASIAIAHRNTYVNQSVLIDPDKAFTGISDGMRLRSPSVFHILLPNEDNAVHPLLWSSAAIEGRAFPAISYSGKADTPWGSRWNVLQNPQVENSWPVHELKLKNEETLTAEFTYADFISLETSCHSEFFKVDAPFWSDELIPLSAYLSMSRTERTGKVPFIWMTDKDLTLFKVAVTWKVAMASLERLDHWQYLQDSGGIHSYHAEHALESKEAYLEENAQKEIELLKAEHQKELDQVRHETTEKAMEQLTAALLDLDPTTLVSNTANIQKSHTPPPTPPEAVEKNADDENTPEKQEEDDLLGPTEPWIETSLCTTCDECTNINNTLFKYNDEKKAFIADAKAGTYAELVQAAENCPVAIIHPGTPLNPNEQDLESLKERAEKFN